MKSFENISVGLDGKFRPFPSSQPQSLEVSNCDRNIRAFQAVEHRFPITNGSLYTSIDGRLPVVHNYRRNKGKWDTTYVIYDTFYNREIVNSIFKEII